ncbi:hypothetical protein N7456_011351 [Penicillium angulare]|uniref:Uncharacterized protein n=1 Tax=Penicillium angulare TaxID=116970 RepID=A0A9W9JZZ6_9EURO|nr:hypothetical protein N7456_011351 [Penicillium angulare]
MNANSLPDFKVIPYESEESLYNEKTANEPISLKTSSSWTYCGPLLSLDPDNLPASFETWADATINGSPTAPLLSFLEFVHDFLSSNNISHYWITIRAEKESLTSKFTKPRWHTDDLFFCPPTPPSTTSSQSSGHRRRSSLNILNISRSKAPRRRSEDQNSPTSTSTSTGTGTGTGTPSPSSSSGASPSISPAQIPTSSPNPTNWKLTTTLLGPGTLFIAQETTPQARKIQQTIKKAIRSRDPEHFCPSVRCAGCAEAAEEVRERLVSELSGHKTVQAQKGECAFFRVGEETGAMHSEPVWEGDGDRIFVNVVPGDERDLKVLMAKWGMEYPRAWCVGLPLQMAEVNWKGIDGF